jgi:hypothetical protein
MRPDAAARVVAARGEPIVIKRFAHVYTKHAGAQEHFRLPEQYDKFRSWIDEHQASAADPYAFGRGHAIVKWYLSNMSYANGQGMYQVITWQDQGRSVVTVEHHPLKASHDV